MLWTVTVYAFIITFGGNSYVMDTKQTIADCGHAIVMASNGHYYGSMPIPNGAEYTCLFDPDHKYKTR